MGDDPKGAARLGKKERQKKKEAAAAASGGPVVTEPEASEVKAKKRKISDLDAPPAETPTDADTSKRKSDTSKSDRAARKERKRRQDVNGQAAKQEASAKREPAEEDERRSAQREIQQLVVRLRAEGKSKHEIEAAKRDLKNGLGKSLSQPDGARAKKLEAWKAANTSTEEGQQKVFEKSEEKRKEGLEHKHDIVVIPVTWRGRSDHQEIEKAATDVKAFLAQQGLDAWVDSRRQYTPGQKFAHWEFRGVMIRVEIGPEDLSAGMLRLCRAKEAGDYKSVEKKRLRLPPDGSRQLLLALKEWGLTQLEIERRDGDSASEEEAPPAAAGNGKNFKAARGTGKSPSAPDPDEDLGGNYAPRVTADPGSKKKKKRRTE